MALGSRTEPLRAELAAALAQRPFELRFWDGSHLPSTDGDGGPVFEAARHARSGTRCGRRASSA